MSKKKKGHEEEHENHERWLVSYADFITLLFAFFVVMYAVSRVDNNRLAAAASAIRFALHFEGTGGIKQMPLFEGPPTLGGTSAVNHGGDPPQEEKAVEVLRTRLEKKLKSFLGASPASVVMIPEGKRLTVRLAAGRFFEPSSATLRPDALPVLDAIASELVPLQRPVRIEGHTDATPIRTERYRNNWDLSAARAASLVAYVEIAHQMDPRYLAAVGMAATRPVAPNDTAAGQERNRRVEIVVEVNPDDRLDFVGN